MSEQRPTGPSSGPLHAERLWPSRGAWLLVLVAAGFGVATGLVGGAFWAAVGGVALAGVVTWALVSASAPVRVEADGTLRVGRAAVAAEHLTGAVGARGEGARQLRGPRLDARTHLCLRGWVDPVVLVGLGDPDDPTPSWLFSTRRPEAVVEALAKVGVSGPVALHGDPAA